MVERDHRTITIGVYPALLDPLSPLFHHPLQGYGKLVSDYLVNRDLPAAYQQIIQ